MVIWEISTYINKWPHCALVISFRSFGQSSFRLLSEFSSLTNRLLSEFSPFCLFRSSGSWEAMAGECKVTLKSSNGDLFDVDEAVAFESQTIKNMIEDTGTASALPLRNVSSRILLKVIDYCKYHVEGQKPADEKSAISKDEIKTWDQEFVKVDQATLFDIILVFCQKTSFNYEFDCLIFFENWI